MKRVCLFLLAACFVFLTACGNQPAIPTGTAVTTTAPSVSVTDTTTVTTAPTAAPTPAQDGWLAAYAQAVRDYDTLLRFRLSSQWSWEAPLPDISVTLRQSLPEEDWLTAAVAELPNASSAATGYGYVLYDLDNNGTPELFWVRPDHSIVAVFTYHNGLKTLGMYRARYRAYVSENGQFYTWGSNGAVDNACHVSIIRQGTLETVFTFGNRGVGILYEGTPASQNEAYDEHYAALEAAFSDEVSAFFRTCTLYPTDHAPAATDGGCRKSSGVSFLPYTQKVPNADAVIMSGPGYRYTQVGTVGEAGIFTMLAEIPGREGVLWGMLKSGKGWINLTDTRQAKPTAPLTVTKADAALLQSGNYHRCDADTSEYAVPVAIRFNDKVTDIAFFSILHGEPDSFETLYTATAMDSRKPLVCSVSFPGPGMSYGVRFTDRDGKQYTYQIQESGRDGSIGFSPYTG